MISILPSTINIWQEWYNSFEFAEFQFYLVRLISIIMSVFEPSYTISILPSTINMIKLNKYELDILEFQFYLVRLIFPEESDKTEEEIYFNST